MIPALLPDDHPLLAKAMPKFDFEAENAFDLAITLIEAMTYYRGIGLAANQVGIEQRAFAMEAHGGPLILFNPLVTWLSLDSALLPEGCLSFPGLELRIRRPSECQVTYQNEFGVTQVKDFKGIEARCALHEIDHLDGVVFTDRVSKFKLGLAKKKAAKRQK